jgi:tripartite ATP-independent transporter DctP family solute receptor
MLNSPRRKPVPGRRWRKLAPAIVSALLLASGCAQVESGGTASGKTELKCAISSPRDSGDYRAVETFAKTLAQKSHDRLTVKVYPDSQLGDYASVIQQIKAGTIDCLYESIGTLATGSEVAGIEAVPYLYRDVDEFSAVWSGEIGKRLLDQVAKDTGIRFVGPAFRGFRQLATQAPLDNIDGLQGLKLRVPAIPAYVNAFEALGASPTPLPFSETYGALQQHVVTGVENSLIGINSQKFFEVAKHIAITDHMAETMGFMFNGSRLDQMDQSLQTAINHAAADSANFYRSYTQKTESEILAELTRAGVTITRPDLAPFRARVATYDPGAQLRPYVDSIRALS